MDCLITGFLSDATTVDSKSLLLVSVYTAAEQCDSEVMRSEMKSNIWGTF